MAHVMAAFSSSGRGDGIPERTDREWLDAVLLEIERHLPRMLRDYPDRTGFWHWFCGETDSCLARTPLQADRLYFQLRINEILQAAGLEERLQLTVSERNPDCVE